MSKHHQAPRSESRDLDEAMTALSRHAGRLRLFGPGGSDCGAPAPVKRQDERSKTPMSIAALSGKVLDKRAAFVATTVLLVISTFGAAPVAASPVVTTAQLACASLSGKTIGGVGLSTVLIRAQGGVPTYCKVSGTIAPALNFEIRLPNAWNGKLYYGGGAGYDGSIPKLVVAPLTQGYAEVVSDSGHQGPELSAAFARKDPIAARLFGSGSVPTVMATALKTLTEAYGAPPTKSYFEGCSNGGREALMAVQRNPTLFDGVIARAPGYNWVGLMGEFNRVSRALAAPGGMFTPAKTALLAKHVRDACDGLDGLFDGIVSNPASCTGKVLNIMSLRCRGGGDTGDACLSDAQLAVVKAWTSDAAYKGAPTYLAKGYNLTGNEDETMNFLMWNTGATADVRNGPHFLFQDTTVKNYLTRNPGADSLKYSPWDRNLAALHRMAVLNDATQTDIRPFVDRGGKLIVWHGGADAGLSVNSTIEYIRNVRRSIGATRAAESTRLYVAPGVDHCEGGAGADQTDLLTALDQWVTQGVAPASLVARKLDANGAVMRALPLCQYPQYPRYTGPTTDPEAARLAKNYACTAP